MYVYIYIYIYIPLTLSSHRHLLRSGEARRVDSGGAASFR